MTAQIIILKLNRKTAVKNTERAKSTGQAQHHKLKEKSKGICQQVPFFMLKYRQGCI